MYDKGQGVPQDYVQAHMLFNLAASRFSASEAEDRNKAVKNRDSVASKMTPAQIAEAQKLAREWKSGSGSSWWSWLKGSW
jgi:TPR repeat protein